MLSFGPLAIGLFMWIVRDPGRADQLGLLGTKADLAGLEATWPAYFSMLTLVVGVGGMLLLSFIIAYLFGREYADRTAKNLLALPVGRQWFVLAKFVVAALWWFALVLAVLPVALVTGLVLRLPGFSAALVLGGSRDALVAAGIAYLLAPVFAWIRTLGRGYLPPLGFALAMLALGNVLAKTGWALWFPWSIVPLSIGMVGKPVQTLPVGSLVVIGLTFLAGIAATILQTRYADNTQ
ncbi:MAG TPA: ABC transporter permease [Dermatophilaceae bacterium]